MRIALIRPRGRIANNKRLDTVVKYEIFSIVNMLAFKGIKTDIFSSISKTDEPYKDVIFKDLRYEMPSSDKYDALIVFNSSSLFFAGSENKLQILNYIAINKFDGKIFYFLNDTLALFKQIDKFVSLKEWGKKYNIEDLVIDDTKKQLYCISQYTDTNKIQELINKQSNTIKFQKIIPFPFEHFLLFTDVKDDDVINTDFKTDLMYLGYNKPQRIPSLINFYFDIPEDISVTISFGKNKLSQFKNYNIKRFPTFTKYVKYTEYIKQLKTAMSTVIIGDLQQKYDARAARVYESIGINVVFVDVDYDTQMKIFKNDKLRKFCYIRNKDELITRIRYLKNNRHLIQKIIDAQVKDTCIDKNEYAEQFINILKGV